MKVENVYPRILVVDDQSALILALEMQLKNMGLNIKCDGATTLDEARTLVKKNCHHYALVGLHIEHADRPDGPSVLDEIRRHWPSALHDCFALYTYKDLDEYTYLKKALDKRFFLKTNVEATANWLAEHVRSKQAGGYNWELEIHFDESASAIDGSLITDIEDTLRQLFMSKENLSVSKLSQQGYSGAVLLQASQTSRAFDPRRFVLKFGKSDAVEREYSNVKQYVLSSSIDCVPYMEKVAYNRVHTYGTIKFHTIETAQTLENKINDVLNEDDLNKCRRHLRTVISSMMRSWYSYPTWIAGPTPSDILPEKFEEYARNNLEEVYKQLGAAKSGDRRICVKVNDKSLVLRDLSFSIPPSLATSERVPQLLVHNDFHTKNILIGDKAENVYLIDFARTSSGMHAYSDFAKMETHIVSDLMFDRVFKSNLHLFFEFVRTMYAPESFINVEKYFDQLLATSLLPFSGRTYIGMLRETRVCWLMLLDQIDHSASKSAHKQWKHYVYAIMIELFQSLWWVKDKAEFTNQRRVSVLYFISILMDINSGRSETSYTEGK